MQRELSNIAAEVFTMRMETSCLTMSWLCFLTRSFSNGQPLETLLRDEATESHGVPWPL